MKGLKQFWKVAADLCPGGDVRLLLREVVNCCAAARGLPAPWETDMPGHAVKDLSAALDVVGDPVTWGAYELGTLYTASLPPALQKERGSYYTPTEVADSMARGWIGPQLDRLEQGDLHPCNLLQIYAIDPACGAGVFLVAVARLIAHRYAARVWGGEPTAAMVRLVMPEVMTSCVHGCDIDPIAVDLSKSVCWLETGGSQPIGFMDDNITIGNVLAGDLPPHFADAFPNPAMPDFAGVS